MYGSPTEARRGNVHINCPFGLYHSKGIDTSQGLSVKIVPNGRSVAFCFSCHAKGLLSFVFDEAAKLDSGFVAVAQFITSRDGPSLSGALARLRDDGEVQEVPTSDWAAYASRCARQVPVYLVNRGIIQEDVRKWLLGFDVEYQRAIFPVRDETGKIVGALRRGVHDGQDPKYLDTPGAFLWKKTVFYGEHNIDNTVSTAIAVEGPMGTVFTARLFPNVLGMMGADTGFGPERLAKLQKWGIKTLILMLDADEKGYSSVYGKRLPDGEWDPGYRDQLRRYFVVKVAKLPRTPEGKKLDPDDVVRADPTALRTIISSAAYLEATNLTGGSEHGKTPMPQRGVAFMDFLKDRKPR